MYTLTIRKKIWGDPTHAHILMMVSLRVLKPNSKNVNSSKDKVSDIIPKFSLHFFMMKELLSKTARRG